MRMSSALTIIGLAIFAAVILQHLLDVLLWPL